MLGVDAGWCSANKSSSYRYCSRLPVA